MADLFETTTINGLELKNRFVRSATWEGLATDQDGPPPALVDLLVTLARGEVGLIVTGHMFVSAEGRANARQVSLAEDGLVSQHGQLVKAVHGAGGRIVAQLAHAGCQAAVKASGLPAMGPSSQAEGPECEEMNREAISRVIEAFAAAARRARQAGYDGVQIHAAHGYLLSQFLSPSYNHRRDEYGGTLTNRARLVLQVYEAIRREVGDRFPVLIKMNSQDYLDDGLTVDEMLEVARALHEAGIDAIELSGGTHRSGPFTPVRKGTPQKPGEEAYYREAAARFQGEISVPLILVGGIRSYQVARELVTSGTADYISLCRPLIREPDLVKRWHQGDHRPSGCRSDNLCFRPAIAGNGLYCVTAQREKRSPGS